MTTHLTPEQVSERYAGRVSVETLAQWRWRKRGPRYMKLGRSVLYSVRALRVGKTGEPGHPLYIGYDVQPQLWSAPKLRPDGSPDCGR